MSLPFNMLYSQFYTKGRYTIDTQIPYNPKYPPTNKQLGLQKNKCQTLAKKMSQLTVWVGGYKMQLSYQVTRTTNAKSFTSQYSACTRP